MSQLSRNSRANTNQRPPRSRWTVNSGGRQPFVQNRPSNLNIGMSLPSAYATHVRPRFNVLSRSGDSVRVSGCDLVYQLPTGITTNSESIFSVIPANPNYWVGTRIAQFAAAYQNFRPVAITFSYIPQVAVTQQGTVVMGTLWNDSPPTQNLQQSLFTSNGGTMTQCYVPCDTSIALGSNLQQNLFTGSGDLNYDTNPFTFIALLRGGNVIPGYFYVSYVFDFKNAIGLSREFNNYSTTAASVNYAQNVSILLKDPITGYGAGTILDVEFSNTSTFSFNYHGTPVTVPETTNIQVFSNSQLGGPAQLLDERIRLLEAQATPELMSVRVSSVNYDIKDFTSFIGNYPPIGATVVIATRKSDGKMVFAIIGADRTALPFSDDIYEKKLYDAAVPNNGNMQLLSSTGSILTSVVRNNTDTSVLVGYLNASY